MGTAFLMGQSGKKLVGNAVTGDVLITKTFSNAVSNTLVGTMPNNGAVSHSLPINGTYTIPVGYHNGSGTITQNITTRGAQTYTPNSSTQTIPSGIYLTGVQTISAVANLSAANIANGVTIGGVTGTYKGIGNASMSQVLSGTTFSTTTLSNASGTMVNNGAVTATLSINGTYTIPQGYHSGSGTVTQSITVKATQTYTPSTANQVISAGQYLTGDQTILGDADLVAGNIAINKDIFGIVGTYKGVGTAGVAQVLTGYTFSTSTLSGSTGTMPNNGAVSYSLPVNGAYTIPAGYHNGNGSITQSLTVKNAQTYTPSTVNQTIASGQYLTGAQTISGDANLVTGNIKSGVSIFGVTGKASVVDTADATMPDSTYLLTGVNAYVNGSKVTGTMTNHGAVAPTITTQGGTQYIPMGYHNGWGYVTANISNLVAGNIKSGVNVGGVVGDLKPARSYTKPDVSQGYYYGTGSNVTLMSTTLYNDRIRITASGSFIAPTLSSFALGWNGTSITLTSSVPFYILQYGEYTNVSIGSGKTIPITDNFILFNPYSANINYVVTDGAGNGFQDPGYCTFIN